VTAFGYTALQYVSTFHSDTKNSVLYCEIQTCRFPENLHEQQVSPIGCQSKRSTVILHFAGITTCMEIVCKVKIHKQNLQ